MSEAQATNNTEQKDKSNLSVVPHSTTTTSLVLDHESLGKMMQLAEIMAKGVATVPQHLQKNASDCLAVIMQSMQWKMNPYAVAQKTHLIKGVLGYEAQLVNAVITSIAPTKDRLNFEWFGDWSKVTGKFKIQKNKEQQEYRVPGWTLADEEGLGVRVWATLKGESKPRELKVLLAQARTRNSTMWADDPQQQLAYLATKKWSRLYTPDVIMGVYTPDEVEQFDSPGERDITDSSEVIPNEYPEEAFRKNYPKWREAIQSGAKTHDDWINTLSAKGRLSESQLSRIHEVQAPTDGEVIKQ